MIIAFLAVTRTMLGPERDLDHGSTARPRADRRCASDARRTLPDVAQALPGTVSGLLEPRPVVGDRDEPLSVPGDDPHFRTLGLRVLAHVREPLLDDPEDLDLLVGCEDHPRVDLDVDLE